MKTSEKLLKAVEPIWESYYTHPFIKGIQDGSLSKEKFKYYMVQDYLYLLEYVKVFALGVQKGRDEKTMAFFANMLNLTLNGELEVHRGYLAELGVSADELYNAPVELDNLSYTSYMIAVGQNGTIADVLVAVAACAVSYGYIGRYIAENGGDIKHEFYGGWIQAYSAKEYQDSENELLAMIDEACECISDKEYKHLEEVMINCSKYEYLFWDFAYNGNN